MTRPDPTSTRALHLSAADWEDVLDGLGAAAERTSANIDCTTCASDAVCVRHDGDWARVDRWRELATHLRDQLNRTHRSAVPGRSPLGRRR
jgi:hypothetical protein